MWLIQTWEKDAETFPSEDRCYGQILTEAPDLPEII